MQNRRELFAFMGRQMSAYSVAVFIDRAASIFMLPILTRVLAPSDYGVMELLDFTAGIVGMTLGVRLGQAIACFCSDLQEESNRHKYLSAALLGSIVAGVLATSAMALLAARLSQALFHSSAYAPYFRLMAVSVGLSFPSEVGLAYIRVLGQAWLFTRISICRLTIAATSMLLLVVRMRMGVAGWIWSAILPSFLVTCFVIWYVSRRLKFSFAFRHLYDMVAYSAPLNISALAMFFIHFGDRWFLSRQVSLAEIGVYGLAYKFGMLIAYVQVPFSIFWNTQMFGLEGRADGEHVYARICTYTALSFSLAAVVLANFIHPIASIAVGPGFRSVAEFVPVIALAYVVRAVGEFVRSVFLLKRRTDLDAWITGIGAAICLAGYQLLIPAYKLWGAVLATGLTFLSMLILSFWQGQKLFRYPYEWYRLSLIGAYAALFCAIPFMFTPHLFLLQIGMGLAAVGAFPVALLGSGFLIGEERVFLKTMLTGALQRLSGSAPKPVVVPD